MAFAIQDAEIYLHDDKNKIANVVIDNGKIFEVTELPQNMQIFKKCIIIPGLADVHVHLREPGFSYKETIFSGTHAAAHGGYTSICCMPNIKPTPDCLKNLNIELEAIKKDSIINVVPYGTITKEENGILLSDMDEMSEYVCAFSDDGKGVQNSDIMLKAMRKAKSINKIIAAHCEDNSLLNGGYIHDGTYAAMHGHKGICSKSEYAQVERDIKLAKITGCSYHVCHISTKESVNLIRQAKAEGVDITCETAPHYLTLCQDDLIDDGRFKMNPPLRNSEDKNALIMGLCDGTIDIIATDHAPHSFEEKNKGLKDSLMGVSGLEAAFPILYTKLVHSGIIDLKKLIQLMSENPKRRFNIKTSQDFTVFDVSEQYTINAENFISKSKSTPFDGEKVYAKCLITVLEGKTVWQDSIIKN